jgi:hypothetical protein
MPPIKYWEIVADKLSAAGWVMGLLHRRYPEVAGGGLLTPAPKRIGLKSDMRLSDKS